MDENEPEFDSTEQNKSGVKTTWNMLARHVRNYGILMKPACS